MLAASRFFESFDDERAALRHLTVIQIWRQTKRRRQTETAGGKRPQQQPCTSFRFPE